MKTHWFVFFIFCCLGLGFWNWQLQRVAIAEVKSLLDLANASPEIAPNTNPPNHSPLELQPPSPELLRLRSEVTFLQQELNAPNVPEKVFQSAADDWALVHSGPKPSEQAGYIPLADVAHEGFATPETTLKSFYYAMQNQSSDPFTPSRTKQFWDVPEDFDAPEAKYSINIGEGIGSEVGFRVVSQDWLGSNTVRLTLDYERRDGSSFRTEKILVQRDGHWRLKPVRVTRPDPLNGVEE